jgi:hypothetical protein
MKLTKEQDKNLLEAAEEFFDYSPCMHCKHYFDDEDEDSERFNEPSACDAFPEGIPEEIFFGRNLHLEPYPEDHGITFADKDIDEEGEGEDEEGKDIGEEIEGGEGETGGREKIVWEAINKRRNV